MTSPSGNLEYSRIRIDLGSRLLNDIAGEVLNLLGGRSDDALEKASIRINVLNDEARQKVYSVPEIQSKVQDALKALLAQNRYYQLGEFCDSFGIQEPPFSDKGISHAELALRHFFSSADIRRAEEFISKLPRAAEYRTKSAIFGIEQLLKSNNIRGAAAVCEAYSEKSSDQKALKINENDKLRCCQFLLSKADTKSLKRFFRLIEHPVLGPTPETISKLDLSELEPKLLGKLFISLWQTSESDNRKLSLFETMRSELKTLPAKMRRDSLIQELSQTTLTASSITNICECLDLSKKISRELVIGLIVAKLTSADDKGIEYGTQLYGAFRVNGLIENSNNRMLERAKIRAAGFSYAKIDTLKELLEINPDTIDEIKKEHILNLLTSTKTTNVLAGIVELRRPKMKKLRQELRNNPRYDELKASAIYILLKQQRFVVPRKDIFTAIRTLRASPRCGLMLLEKLNSDKSKLSKKQSIFAHVIAQSVMGKDVRLSNTFFSNDKTREINRLAQAICQAGLSTSLIRQWINGCCFIDRKDSGARAVYSTKSSKNIKAFTSIIKTAGSRAIDFVEVIADCKFSCVDICEARRPDSEYTYKKYSTYFNRKLTIYLLRSFLCENNKSAISSSLTKVMENILQKEVILSKDFLRSKDYKDALSTVLKCLNTRNIISSSLDFGRFTGNNIEKYLEAALACISQLFNANSGHNKLLIFELIKFHDVSPATLVTINHTQKRDDSVIHLIEEAAERLEVNRGSLAFDIFICLRYALPESFTYLKKEVKTCKDPIFAEIYDLAAVVSTEIDRIVVENSIGKALELLEDLTKHFNRLRDENISTDEIAAIRKIVRITHINSSLVFRSLKSLDETAVSFKRILDFVEHNNAFTRIMRMLGESSGTVGGQRELIISIREQGQWLNLKSIIEELAEKHADQSPQYINNLLSNLIIYRSQANIDTRGAFLGWSKQDWIHFISDINYFTENIFPVLNLTLFNLYKNNRNDAEFAYSLRNDLQNEYRKIQLGTFFGFSSTFIEKYNLSLTDQVGLFCVFWPVKGMLVSDSCYIINELRETLTRCGIQKWQSSIPDSLRTKANVLASEVVTVYNGELTIGTRLKRDKKLAKLIFGREVVTSDKLTELYKACLSEDVRIRTLEEFKIALLSELINTLNINISGLEIIPKESERVSWLARWDNFFNDILINIGDELLTKVCTNFLSELAQSDLEFLSFPKQVPLEKFQLNRTDKDVLRALNSFIERNHDEYIDDAASALAKKFSNVSIADLTDGNKFKAWCASNIPDIVILYSNKIKNESSEIEFFMSKAIQAAVAIKISKEEGKLIAGIKKHCMELFNTDRSHIANELRSYKSMEIDGESQLSIGLYDDLFHLSEFLMSNVCTAIYRPTQVRSRAFRFANISLKDEQHRVIATSQVQLLPQYIVEHGVPIVESKWNVLSLPGLFFDSSSNLISREKAFLGILGYAQKMARKVGLQGAVIPVDGIIHAQNGPDKEAIKGLCEAGRLKKVALSGTVPLGGYSYREVFLIDIPDSECHIKFEPVCDDRQIAEGEFTVQLQAKNVSQELIQEFQGILTDSLAMIPSSLALGEDIVINLSSDTEVSSMNASQLTIGRDILLGQAINDTKLRSLLAELIISKHVPDFYELKRQSAFNENAFYKLELLKSIINHEFFFEYYHGVVSKNEGLWSSKSEQGKGILVRKYRSDLIKATDGMTNISQWSGFMNIFDDADPRFVIVNYMFLLLQNSSASFDYAALFQRVKDIDISSWVSFASMRDIVGVFILNNNVWVEQDVEMQPVEKFKYFSRKEYYIQQQSILVNCNNNQKFTAIFAQFLSSFLPTNVLTKEMDYVISSKFDQKFCNANRSEKNEILKEYITDLLKRTLGGRSFECMVNHLSAKRGSEFIPYFDFYSISLPEGEDADTYREIALEDQRPSQGDWYQKLFFIE